MRCETASCRRVLPAGYLQVGITVTCAVANKISAVSYSRKALRKSDAGFLRARRSYSASVARASLDDADENLATVTIPSGLSGSGAEANLTISSS